jgi:hypothetical protein
MNNTATNSNPTTIASPPSKRSSLSSRASKIPQKLAQSSFFSLKPSTSTLVNNNNNNNNNNNGDGYYNNNNNNSSGITARIGQMLFRQRTTSESIIKESRSVSIQSLEYSSFSLGRNNHQSRSLDIKKNHINEDGAGVSVIHPVEYA